MVRRYRLVNMHLLAEWEGRTGKYLAGSHSVRNERSEDCTRCPTIKFLSSQNKNEKYLHYISNRSHNMAPVAMKKSQSM